MALMESCFDELRERAHQLLPVVGWLMETFIQWDHHPATQRLGDKEFLVHVIATHQPSFGHQLLAALQRECPDLESVEVPPVNRWFQWEITPQRELTLQQFFSRPQNRYTDAQRQALIRRPIAVSSLCPLESAIFRSLCEINFRSCPAPFLPLRRFWSEHIKDYLLLNPQDWLDTTAIREILLQIATDCIGEELIQSIKTHSDIDLLEEISQTLTRLETEERSIACSPPCFWVFSWLLHGRKA